MARSARCFALIGALLLAGSAFTASASPTSDSTEVTDFGRNRWRNHYTPTNLEYPTDGARALWEVPLGLSRSQPLIVERDYTGTPERRIYHVAGDQLWALDDRKTQIPSRQNGQSAESYRQQLQSMGFILWHTPATALCSERLTAKDWRLSQSCSAFQSWRGSHPNQIPQRSFASSSAAYWKGGTPADDVVYVGFGFPASIVAIRAQTGEILGGYVVDVTNDRGIVGAPLVFPGDVVVIGTTSGESVIVTGLASGQPSARVLEIGGRISSAPVPIGETAFIVASDARWSQEAGTHGFIMAYNLRGPTVREFSQRWPAAVVTPNGIPGDYAADDRAVYLSDKYGRLYSLRIDNGEMLWCRQYPGMVPCRTGGNPSPAFINNGPGVDTQHVYYVYHNSQGPTKGGGYVVALNKATGQKVWEQYMQYPGTTAPVPMGKLLLVGDADGWMRAFDKETGQPVTRGGYPLRLSDHAYQSGDQGERWWEKMSGTATQMSVVDGLMLFGVNSKTDEETVLKAFRLGQLFDLTLETLGVPNAAAPGGFEIVATAVCRGCDGPLTTSVSLKLNGREQLRQAANFNASNGYKTYLRWPSGPLPAGSVADIVATVDPSQTVVEFDETNNSLQASVSITTPDDPGDHNGSDLVN